MIATIAWPRRARFRARVRLAIDPLHPRRRARCALPARDAGAVRGAGVRARPRAPALGHALERPVSDPMRAMIRDLLGNLK
jgi:hypothetical protein